MTEQPNEGAGEGGKQGGSDLAKAILARAAAKAGGQAGGSDIDGQTDLPEELQVDVGGAKRVVKVKDLVAAFTDHEKTLAAQKKIEDRLAELGDLNAIRSLKDTIEALDPDRREKVLRLLTGEGGGEDDEVLDDDDEPGGTNRNGKANGHADLQRLDRIEKAVMALAARENGRLHSERTTTLSEAVQKEMAQYPVFASNAEASSFARDSIMTLLSFSKDGNVSESVREAAKKLQALIDRQRQEANAEVGMPRTMVQLSDKERKGLNGKSLQSGDARRLAQAQVERILRSRGNH